MAFFLFQMHLRKGRPSSQACQTATRQGPPLEKSTSETPCKGVPYTMPTLQWLQVQRIQQSGLGSESYRSKRFIFLSSFLIRSFMIEWSSSSSANISIAKIGPNKSIRLASFLWLSFQLGWLVSKLTWLWASLGTHRCPPARWAETQAPNLDSFLWPRLFADPM